MSNCDPAIEFLDYTIPYPRKAVRHCWRKNFFRRGAAQRLAEWQADVGSLVLWGQSARSVFLDLRNNNELYPNDGYEGRYYGHVGGLGCAQGLRQAGHWGWRQ